MGSGSVLVVDDEPTIALSLEYLMREQGFDVRVARDDAAALAALSERPADVVLFDATLPTRDAVALCQNVRANPEWSGVRIILLTPRGRPAAPEGRAAPGPDDTIIKPFSTRELIDRVRHHIPGQDG